MFTAVCHLVMLTGTSGHVSRWTTYNGSVTRAIGGLGKWKVPTNGALFFVGGLTDDLLGVAAAVRITTSARMSSATMDTVPLAMIPRESANVTEALFQTFASTYACPVSGSFVRQMDDI